MNKRELRRAFVKAMNKIRKSPHRYEFMESDVPKRERGRCQGCVLAWVAFYAGQPRGFGFDAAPLIGGLTAREREIFSSDSRFYRRMDNLTNIGRDGEWRDHADVAAKILKRYIAKYLPAKKRAT